MQYALRSAAKRKERASLCVAQLRDGTLRMSPNSSFYRNSKNNYKRPIVFPTRRRRPGWIRKLCSGFASHKGFRAYMIFTLGKLTGIRPPRVFGQLPLLFVRAGAFEASSCAVTLPRPKRCLLMRATSLACHKNEIRNR